MNSFFAHIMARVSCALREVFTGADNETLAWGRVLSLPYMVVGWALPFAMAHMKMPFTLSEAAVFLPAHAAGAMALVRGTAGTEPSGGAGP
jgi:hypothetical protein